MAQGVQVTVGSQLLARVLPLLPGHSGAPSRKTQVPLLLYSPQVGLPSSSAPTQQSWPIARHPCILLAYVIRGRLIHPSWLEKQWANANAML